MKIKAIIFLLIINSLLINGDSLWDNSFKGYLSSGKAIKPGDTVLVIISTQSSLSLTGASKENKSLTLEFTKGDNPFDFLPGIQVTGTGKGENKSELELESSLTAVVDSFTPEGLAYITGERSITVDGKSETMELTAFLSPGDLSVGRSIPFSRLAKSKLTYKTLLEPEEDLLTNQDFLDLTALLQPSPPPAETPPEEGTDTAGTTEDTAPSPATEAASKAAEKLQLTEEKKRELVLKYLNRLVFLIFN